MFNKDSVRMHYIYALKIFTKRDFLYQIWITERKLSAPAGI